MEQFPNVNVYGKIPLFFERIQQAAVPDKFTYKILIETLGFKGTNDRPLISLLKCLEFIDGDRNPTNVYRSYRNTETSAATLGKQIKKCYSRLYERNESIHEQDNTTIQKLFEEISGKEHNNTSVKNMYRTFFKLKDLADFTESSKLMPSTSTNSSQTNNEYEVNSSQTNNEYEVNSKKPFQLTHTIVLNLPAVSDPLIYDALFKSLKENLL